MTNLPVLPHSTESCFLPQASLKTNKWWSETQCVQTQSQICSVGNWRATNSGLSPINRLPRWLTASGVCLQHKRRRRRGFSPWVGKIPLEEGMATHTSILAWRIPWAEGPGGLQSLGSQRVRHHWSNWNTLLNFMWLMWAFIFLTHSQKAIQVRVWWPKAAYRAKSIFTVRTLTTLIQLK